MSPDMCSRGSSWGSAAPCTAGGGLSPPSEADDTPPSSSRWRGSAPQTGEARSGGAHSASSDGSLSPPPRFLAHWRPGGAPRGCSLLLYILVFLWGSTLRLPSAGTGAGAETMGGLSAALAEAERTADVYEQAGALHCC